MKAYCDLRVEDLIAFRDGELNGARLEYTEAHIRACEVCGERLANLNETGRLLDEGTPSVDDTERRAALKSRIYELHAQRPQRPILRILPGLTWGRILVPVLVVIVALVGLAWPTMAQADVGIGSIVRDILPGVDRLLPGGDEPPGTPLREQELGPFVTPIHLPPDLELYHAAGNGPEHLELRYRNDQGTDLLLMQTTPDEDVEVYSPRSELAVVDGAEVLMLPDSRPDAVARLIWERNGVRFQLAPITVPEGHDGGLPASHGLAIVEAVSEVQDTRTE